MIKKVKGGYIIVSESTGKRLSKPATWKKSVKRLREIEYFKNHPKKGK